MMTVDGVEKIGVMKLLMRRFGKERREEAGKGGGKTRTSVWNG
jgi:hypothetical protein